MRLPSVVFDGDLEFGVGEVETDDASPDAHTVLLHGAGQAAAEKKLGDIRLFLASARSDPVEAVGEDGSHDRAAAASPGFENSKHADELARRNEPSAFRVVYQSLDAPRPDDRGEIAQGPGDRRDGNSVLSRAVIRSPYIGLVHDHVGQPRVLTARNRDLEDVGVEARQIPEHGRSAKRRDRMVTDRKAGREEVLMPRLGCAGTSIDAASNRFEGAGGHQVGESPAATDFQRLLGRDQTMLAVPDATQLSHPASMATGCDNYGPPGQLTVVPRISATTVNCS